MAIKQNDWIIAGITNPDVSVNEFILSGVNIDNTQLLTADEYKKSNFIKDKFSQNGVFNESAFDSFYKKRVEDFGRLQSLSKVDTFQYDPFDTRAGASSIIKSPGFSFTQEANPDRDTTIFTNDIYKDGLSQREHAQSNVIWDSAKEEWTEDTVNDRSFTKSPLKWIKTFFGEPLVYATYDSDGEHYDQYTGRTVKHKKGEYKLNQYGTIYTETLNGRSLVGKEVVSALDVITVDNQGLDKYNFFDSDSLDKSVAGTIALSAATIAPLLMGSYVAPIYSGVLIARELAKSLPMLYGFFTAWTDLPKDNSVLNNLAAKANVFTGSMSDYGRSSTVNFEVLNKLITDVATQYGQQKLIAKSISKLRGSQSLMDDAYNKAGLQYMLSRNMLEENVSKGIITKETLAKYAGSQEKWMESVIGKAAIQNYMKEVEPIVQNYVKLGQSASLVYMALVSNTDVYSSMLEAGASKKEAAAVALGSTIGMFSVDKYLHLGELFFDDATAAYENQIRRTFKKEASNWYNNIIKSRASEVSDPSSKFKNILHSSIEYGKKRTNQFVEDLKYHTTGFFGKSFGEGIEEVSEELVTDLSKQLYELAGTLGFNTSVKDVGAWDNWQARYGMSFLGGTLGGGLFYGVDIYQNGKFQIDRTQDELIYLIRNGKTNEALKTLEDWKNKGKLGSTSLSIETTTDENGNKVFLSADNKESQNDFIYRRIKESIVQLDGIINENQAKLSEDDLFQNMVLSESRFRELQKFFNVQDYSYITSYQRDYQNVLNKIVNIEETLKRADKTDTGLNYESDEEYNSHILTDEKRRNLSEIEKSIRDANLSRIQEDLNSAKEELQNFLSGKYSLDYTEKLLFALDNKLNSEFVSLTFDDWLKKYHSGKVLESLSPAERQKYKEEYLNYKKVAQVQDLNEKYEIFKALTKQMNPVLSKIEKNQDNFRFFKEKLQQLSEIESPKLYNFDDVLDFMNETEEDESFINRDSENYAFQRYDAINQYNNQQREIFKNKVLDIIDSAGGFIDSVSRRKFKLWINDRIKDRLNTLRNNVSIDMIRANGVLTNLDSDVLQLLETINVNNIDENNIRSQIEQLVKNSYVDPIIKSNNLLNGLSGYLYDLGVFADSGYISGQEINNWIEPQINEGKSINDILDINTFQGYNQYGLSDSQFAAFLTQIQQKYNNGELETYLWEYQDSNDIKNDQDYQQDLAYYMDLYNTYINSIKSDAIISLHQELDEKISDINPVTDLVKKLALHLNVNMENLEKILQNLDARYEQLDSIDEFILDSTEKESFEEAAYIIKLAQAYINAAARIPNIINEFGHNSTINEFASKHSDIYKDFNELPVLSEDIAAMYITELNEYLSEMGIQDEKTGQYNPGSWQWLSAQNEINKAQQFIKADKAWNKTCYDLFSFGYNSGAFKFNYKGVDYDLLEGFENIPQITENTKDAAVHLNKLFNLYYNNIQKLRNKGWTYKQILERSQLLDKFTVLGEIPQQNTCSLDQNVNFDRLTSYDKMIFLTTIAAMNSTKFNSYLRSRIAEEDGIAPLTIQEWISRVGISYIENPEIFKQTLEYVKEKTNCKKPIILGVYISGNAGAGKTRVVARNQVKYIQDDNIWLSTPKESQIDTLFESVTKGTKMLNREVLRSDIPSLITRMGVDKAVYKEVFDLIQDKDFIEKAVENKINSPYFVIEQSDDSLILRLDYSKFGIKKINNPPKAIVIDEVTHLSNLELQLINEFCRLNNTKLILIGDDKQKGFRGLGNNIDREQCFTIRTPNLGISLRDNNIQHQFNLKKLESLIDYLSDLEISDPEYNVKVKNVYTVLKTIQFKIYNTDDIHGELLTDQLTDETIKKLHGTIGYVGSSNSSTLTALHNANLNPTILNETAIQGQEFDYIIIDKSFAKIDQNSKDLDLLNFLQDLYTMISRGKKGSIIIDSDKSLENIIGSNIVEFSKAEAKNISTYTQKFREEKIALLDKILSSNEEPPQQDSVQPIADKDFDIDSLDFENNHYVLYETSSGQVNEILNDGLKLSDLPKQLMFATKDVVSKIIQNQKLDKSKSNIVVLLKFNKNDFKDIDNLKKLSDKLTSLGNDLNYVPLEYINFIIETVKDDIPEDIKTNPNNAAEIPQASENELQELMGFEYSIADDSNSVTNNLIANSSNYSNPILGYGNVTFTGFKVKKENGKEIWINDSANQTVKRDIQIFTSKDIINDDYEQINLSLKIKELKEGILYKKDWSSLSEDITKLISEDQYNNIQWVIEVRKQNEYDNLIRNTGFTRDKMPIGKEKLVYSVVGKFKLKDGTDATITLGLLADPQKWIDAIPGKKQELQQKINNLKRKKSLVNSSSEENVIQEQINKYEQQITQLNIDDPASTPNKYLAYIEELEEQYRQKQSPIEIKIKRLITPGLTDLHKTGTIVPLSRRSKALIKNAESRLEHLKTALDNVKGDADTKRKIYLQIGRVEKKLEEFKQIRDSSLRSLNPYTVISPMYIYTPSGSIRDNFGVDDSVVGRCNVVFVSNNRSLDPEKLVDIYIQQKNQLRILKEEKGQIDFMDLNMVPSVRMVVLNNLGVSFQDLSNPYLSDSMRTRDPNDPSQFKNIFPFKTNFMGIRMYVGLWNFRSNLLQFKNKLDNFIKDIIEKELNISRDNLSNYLILKDLLWRQNHGRVLDQDEKEWLSRYKNLANYEEVFLAIDQFNESLGNQVKQFRLGSDLDNGAYVRQLTGNIEGLYTTKENINGIYINPSTLEKYLNLSQSLFKNVLDHIVKCDYDPNKLLSTEEGVKNSFANHIISLINTNEEIEILDKGEKQVVHFNSSYDPENNNGILNTFSHIPAVLSKVFKYTSLRQTHLNGDNFDTNSEYSIRIKSTIKKDGKEEKINNPIPYWELWKCIDMIEHVSEYDIELIQGLEFDPTLSNFFSFAFHGSLESIHDPNVQRASDALFPKGFYADPLSTSEIVLSEGQKIFTKVEQQDIFFGTNVRIGDPTFFVLLEDMKDGINEVKKDKQNVDVIDQTTQVVNDVLTKYPQLTKELEDIKSDIDALQTNPDMLDIIKNEISDVLQKHTTDNRNYIFDGNSKPTIDMNILFLQDSDTTALTLLEVISQKYNKSFGQELGKINKISVDRNTIIIETENETLEMTKGLNGQINISRPTKSQSSDSEVIKFVGEVINLLPDKNIDELKNLKEALDIYQKLQDPDKKNTIIKELKNVGAKFVTNQNIFMKINEVIKNISKPNCI